MTKPLFTGIAAANHGFKPEGKKPSKSNVKALGKFLTFSGDSFDMNNFENWDQVLAETYRQLAFFRLYYLGENLPAVLHDGGLRPDFLRSGDRLGRSKWSRYADQMAQWAEGRTDG